PQHRAAPSAQSRAARPLPELHGPPPSGGAQGWGWRRQRRDWRAKRSGSCRFPPPPPGAVRRSGLATGPRHHARGARSVRSPNSTCSLYSEEGRCLTGRPEEDGGQGGEGGGWRTRTTMGPGGKERHRAQAPALHDQPICNLCRGQEDPVTSLHCEKSRSRRAQPCQNPPAHELARPMAELPRPRQYIAA
ncbi:unnamed protein product, partial [Prorocentrum cordatum]